jgi:hypothetical protein
MHERILTQKQAARILKIDFAVCGIRLGIMVNLFDWGLELPVLALSCRWARRSSSVPRSLMPERSKLNSMERIAPEQTPAELVGRCAKDADLLDRLAELLRAGQMILPGELELYAADMRTAANWLAMMVLDDSENCNAGEVLHSMQRW